MRSHLPTARRSLSLSLIALLAACGSTGSGAAAGGDHGSPPATQDQRMEWWRQARFGLFLHWGLYSIPAGKWVDKDSHGEWIRTTAQIPLATYEQFRAQWDPHRFDADLWAQMAADAGMQYVVITSKHHDGFCLWDSAATDWDIGGARNHTDVLGELAAACARHGLRFCTYHSIMDWHHPDYLPRRDWEKSRPTAGADFERFERYLHAQVTELVERYHPAVMWFDGQWESTWNHERGLRLWNLCRRLDPWMIVNNRVDVHRAGMNGFADSQEAVGDFQTPEQEIPATGVPGVDWESCMTMNDHWGWNAADTHWKSTKEMLRNLIDIASKGGNYLLNIGPRPDGTFPDLAVQRLRELGAWMRTNGESIHGTTASVFDSLPWGRCTVKSAGATTTLYLHVFDAPRGGELELPGLANHIVAATPLAAKDMQLKVAADHGSVRIAMPKAIDPIATVIAVTIDGAPIVYRKPAIEADCAQFVRRTVANVRSPAPELDARYTMDGSDPGPASPRAEGPIEIAASCVLKARTFRGGEAVSGVAECAFELVAPAPAVEPVAPHAGLWLERYAVDWDRIPDDRSGLKPIAKDEAATIGFTKNPGEHLALRFSGFLAVRADELYRFALLADDGSKLWIDGELVVDNDGLHSVQEQRGHKALAAGLHAIELWWFNKTGGAELKLSWAGPGEPFADVPATALRH